jgi:hypothetical protein
MRIEYIEYIAREPPTVSNHGVASAGGRWVRFLCEKPPDSSQRQPMRPFLTVLAAASRSPATVSLDRRLKMRQAANMCDRTGYGVLCHMKALLAFHDKQVLPDGAIVAMKIWEVATPVVGSAHKLKYSLFYGANGKRLVGYDDERGKGDDRHIGDHQERYVFKTVELLMADFLADVRHLRDEQ